MSDKIQVPANHSGFKTIETDNATFIVGVEAGNVINLTITLKNGDEALTQKIGFFGYLSDDANGDSLTGTAPSGIVDISPSIPIVAKKAFQIVTGANGVIAIDITEVGTATWFFVVVLPSGELIVSPAITFA